jgi:hypothetical protein
MTSVAAERATISNVAAVRRVFTNMFNIVTSTR